MSKIIFELDNVHFSYLGKFSALCGISMNIKQGEKISVIGANGTGKSSLLQMLDGLIFPDSGTIRAFNQELHDELFNQTAFALDFRKKVGFVFQNPEVQLFCPSVKEDIVFGPLQFGVKPDEIKKRLDQVIEKLAIEHLLDRAPYQLSIGEKRKVAIAGVLIMEPDVIILDEPTAGLDPQTSRQIVDIILLAHEQGKTIITSTHDLHIVCEISDTVYVFDKNKKIARCASPQEILSDKQLLHDNNLTHIHHHVHKGIVHNHAHWHTEHHAQE